MPALSMEPRAVTAQPMLFVRRRVSAQELPKTIGECIGQAAGRVHTAGLVVAGRPFTRYSDMSHGLMTVEAGLPLASPGQGDGEVQAGELQGGQALVALHAGAYDTLGETYAAMERWIAAHGHRPAGPPWESYLTDPADHPNAADWRTEVFWPIA